MNATKIKLNSEAKKTLHQDLGQSVWWTLYLMELGIEIFPNDQMKMSTLVKDLMEIVKVLCKKLNWIDQETEDPKELFKVDHQSSKTLQDQSIVKGQLCEWVEEETKTEISMVSPQSQNKAMVQPGPFHTSVNRQIETNAEGSEITDPLIDQESNSEDMNISRKAVLTNEPEPKYFTIDYEAASAEIPFEADKPLKSETKGPNQPKGLSCSSNSERVSLTNNLGTYGDNNHGKYKCSYCDHKTSKLSYLAQHERTHTGEKLYSCSHCGYKCIQAYDLTKHKRTHTGEKPFKCSKCDYESTTSRNLTRHEKIVHSGEKQFNCTVCEKKFGTKQNLDRHYKLHSRY